MWEERSLYMEKVSFLCNSQLEWRKYLYKCSKSLLEQNYKNISNNIDNDSMTIPVKIIEDNFKKMLYYLKIKILDMRCGANKGIELSKVIM